MRQVADDAVGRMLDDGQQQPREVAAGRRSGWVVDDELAGKISSSRGGRPRRLLYGARRRYSQLRRPSRVARLGRPRRRRRAGGRRGGLEKTRPATIAGAAELEAVRSPDREVSALPGLERSDVVAAERPRTALCCELQSLAWAHRGRAAAAAGDKHCLPDLEEEVAALVRGRAVDAEPDFHARVLELADGARRPPRGAGSTSGSGRRRRRGRRSARSRAARDGCSGRTRHRPRASRPAPGTRRVCSRRARGNRPPPRQSRPGGCGASGRVGGRAPRSLPR